MIDIEEIERIAKGAPSGKWEVWTSCSWRRVFADQGRGSGVRVIEPVTQRHDNHPDLMFGPGVAEWLEGVTPDVVLALISEVRALRERLEIDPSHPYDGIYCRDETIRQLENEVHAWRGEKFGDQLVSVDIHQGHHGGTMGHVHDAVNIGEAITRMADQIHPDETHVTIVAKLIKREQP